MRIEELTIEEFFLKYLKDDYFLLNYFIYEDLVGYMQINKIFLQHTKVSFYYNENKDKIEIDYNDNIEHFRIYKIT